MLLKINSTKQQFLDYLKKHGGATTDEFEAATGIPHQSMGSVTKDLLAANAIARTGERRRTRRGEWADVWDLYDRVKGTKPPGALW